MQGGTLRIQGNTDVTFESNAGILATHATNSGTIDIDIDKNDGTSGAGSNGILSVNSFRMGVVNLILLVVIIQLIYLHFYYLVIQY